MRNSLADVVAAALRVLDAQGLENCSMRRVAAELGVQPSALYHHVSDKQTLLALMADEIVGGLGLEGLGGVGDAAGVSALGVAGSRTASGSRAASGSDPDDDPRALCVALRDAMLAVRDGADVVATATAFRLGSSAVERQLAGLVGVDGARTLLLYTFGHAQATQTHRQAAAFGALLAGAGGGAGASGAAVGSAQGGPDADLDASFERGLDIVLRGLGR